MAYVYLEKTENNVNKEKLCKVLGVWSKGFEAA